MVKRTIGVVLAILLLFAAALAVRSHWMSRDCALMGVCISNLKQIGCAMHLYADEWGGHFPPELGRLYPKYVTDRRTFLCPSKAVSTNLRAGDVALDFSVCYQYTPGLTDKSSPDSILVIDRKGNHVIGHHKGSRNAVFVSGACRLLRSDEAARQP